MAKHAVLSGYITTLKIKQKLDVSSEGPSSRVSSRDRGKCTFINARRVNSAKFAFLMFNAIIDNPEDMSSGLPMMSSVLACL
jgi:hypothetical protein